MNEVNEAWDYGDEYAFGDIEYVCPQITHDIRPCGNQGKNKETKSACTIVGAVNQLIRLFGISLDMETTNKLYIEAVKYCEKYGYVIGSGWSIPTATNVVCKWWNEIAYKTFNKEQVFWLRLHWNDKKVVEALNNGHLVGYGKYVNFGTDQVEGLVWREPKMYPKMVGHRLNFKGIKYTKATGGADISKAEYGSQDNYHGAVGENFAFKQVKPYIYNGIYAYCYIIMPMSATTTTIEEEKKKIGLLKAINSLIGVLSSTWGELPEEFQELSSSYAQALRDQYSDARKLEDSEIKKVTQSVTDFLSYSWKFVDEEDQKLFSDLASHLREKYNLK